MLRIALDIDEVLADFMNSYLNRFGNPKTDYEITRNVQRELSTDKEFWLTLPVINTLNFEPELYCTKRVNPKVWTKTWLKINNFPKRPVYQMFYQKGNKADMIKGRCDVLIDDSYSNVIKAINSGLPALLYTSPWNKDIDFRYRINSLDIKEIESMYELLVLDGITGNKT